MHMKFEASFKKANRLLKKRIKLARKLTLKRDSAGLVKELNWSCPSEYYPYRQDIEEKNKNSMIKGLGIVGDKAFLSDLFNFCSNHSYFIKRDLFMKYSEIGISDSTMTALLSDFIRLGAKSPDFFYKILEEHHKEDEKYYKENEKHFAVLLLCLFRDTKVHPIIIKHLHEPYFDNSEIVALGHLGDIPESVDTLIDLIKKNSTNKNETRDQAINVLSDMQLSQN